MKSIVTSIVVLAAAVSSANAAITIVISQTGTSLSISHAAGSLDLSALTKGSALPAAGGLYTGGSSVYGILGGVADPYTGAIVYSASPGWTAFATRTNFSTSTPSDAKCLFFGEGTSNPGINVTRFYVSGSVIPEFLATINNKTLANLNLTPGTSRTASWSGDSLTLMVAAVPEPTTALLTALSSLCLLRRKRS